MLILYPGTVVSRLPGTFLVRLRRLNGEFSDFLQWLLSSAGKTSFISMRNSSIIADFRAIPARNILFLRTEFSYGTGRTRNLRRNSDEKLSVENQKDDSELLRNIKRLTVRVLDNLDKDSENRTLDEQDKRLLSSTGARLLRLWRIVQKEGESKRAAEAAGQISELSADTKRTEEGSEAC